MPSQKLRQFIFDTTTIFVILSLTYLPFVTKLGIYWDSWRYLNRWRNNGAQAFIEWQSTERPILGYMFSTTHLLLGYSPIAWHISMFIIYTVAILLYFITLRLIFGGNNQRFIIFSGVIIYALYPNYLLHNDSISLQVVPISQLFFAISFLITSLVILYPLKISSPIKLLLFMLSYILESIAIGIYEGWIVLEVLRVYIVWYIIIRDTQSNNLSSAIKAIFNKWYFWVGHGIAPMLMVMFNLLAASGTGSQTDINSYVDTRNIIHLFVNIIKQLTYHGFQNLVNAWISPLQTLLIDMPLLYSPWIVFILAGLSGSVTLLYGVLNLDSPEGKSNKLSWKKGGLITFVGISLLCVGVLPVSIIGKNIQLDWFVFTRWYVFAGIGATTLWISMLYFVFTPITRRVAVALLVTIASLTHLSMASHLAYTWQVEKEYWWQLNWRIPNLEPNTQIIFVTRKYPQLQTLFTLEDASFKFVYAPQKQNVTLNELYTWNGDLEHPHIYEDVVSKLPSNNAIIISAPFEDGCLKVLDPQRNELPNRLENSILAELISFSNANLVLKEPQGQLINDVFGNENTNQWCYFFERADLLRTFGDYQEIIEIYDAVTQQGLSPTDMTEWFPFIESLMVTENYLESYKLLQTTSLKSSYGRVMECGKNNQQSGIAIMNCLKQH